MVIGRDLGPMLEVHVISLHDLLEFMETLGPSPGVIAGWPRRRSSFEFPASVSQEIQDAVLGILEAVSIRKRLRESPVPKRIWPSVPQETRDAVLRILLTASIRKRLRESSVRESSVLEWISPPISQETQDAVLGILEAVSKRKRLRESSVPKSISRPISQETQDESSVREWISPSIAPERDQTLASLASLVPRITATGALFDASSPEIQAALLAILRSVGQRRRP